MPLIVRTVSDVSGRGTPPELKPTSLSTPARIGSMACSPLAPSARAIENASVWPFHDWIVNDEPLRPSSHVSICRAETTGTPRFRAAPTIWSEPFFESLPSSLLLKSVCMFAVNTP